MGNLTEGYRLAVAAHALPPVSPAGLGPAINAIIYFFLAFTAVIVGLRAYVRFNNNNNSGSGVLFGWGWDDILAILGYIFSVPSAVFGVMSTYFGIGHHGSQLYQIRALEYFVYYEIIYFAASTSTKISITITVMRLCGQKRVHRWIAVGNAVVMLVVAVVGGRFVLFNCHPLAVYWNPDTGECRRGPDGLGSLLPVSLAGSVFQMLTDIISATLPFFLISGLQMARRTKAALVGALGLGLLASAAAFSRMLFYRYWDTEKYPNTVMHFTGIILLTSQLELGLGVVACNVPPLRRLFKSMVTSFRMTVSGSASDAAGRTGGGSTQLSALASKSRNPNDDNANWARLDDDKNSTDGSGHEKNSADGSSHKQVGIVQQTTVTVESSKAETGSNTSYGWSEV